MLIRFVDEGGSGNPGMGPALAWAPGERRGRYWIRTSDPFHVKEVL